MRRTATFMGAAALALFATTGLAQDKPNFAGKWTMIPDTANAGGRGGGRGGRGGLGPEATIAQDAKAITITRTTQAGEIKTVYNLDGSDSKNTMNAGGNPIDQVSKVTWDGAKMVVTTSSNFNGNPTTTTATWQFDGAGNLVIESTGPGRGGGPPTTTKMTYKKG